MNGYPRWYVNDMRQLENDLGDGFITTAEFNQAVRELEEELDEWEKDQTSKE